MPKKQLCDNIIDLICHFYDENIEDVKSKKRNMEYVNPRFISMFFIKKYTRFTLKKIGLLFNRHHTSVIHAIKTVKDISDYDQSFKKDLTEIENQIKKVLL